MRATRRVSSLSAFVLFFFQTAHVSRLALEEERGRGILFTLLGFKWTAILFSIISLRSLQPLKRDGGETLRKGERGEGGRERGGG